MKKCYLCINEVAVSFLSFYCSHYINCCHHIYFHANPAVGQMGFWWFEAQRNTWNDQPGETQASESYKKNEIWFQQNENQTLPSIKVIFKTSRYQIRWIKFIKQFSHNMFKKTLLMHLGFFFHFPFSSKNIWTQWKQRTK